MTEDLMLEYSAEAAKLCYLSASRIEGPLPSFDGLAVRSGEGRKIGRLDGIIINPAERRVRYLVVDAAKRFRHHRYLVPLEATTVDAERRELRVDIDRADLAQVEELDDHEFSTFSDEDLKATPF
jgi:sporulation protein YlmC with PRC-barrel domain